MVDGEPDAGFYVFKPDKTLAHGWGDRQAVFVDGDLEFFGEAFYEVEIWVDGEIEGHWLFSWLRRAR